MTFTTENWQSYLAPIIVLCTVVAFIWRLKGKSSGSSSSSCGSSCGCDVNTKNEHLKAKGSTVAPVEGE